MDGEQLYSAVVTSVPFLPLTLVAETRVFGHTPWDRKRLQRIGAAVLDGFMLLALAVAFFTSLRGLTVDEPPDLRLWAAYGLGLGAVAALAHSGGRRGYACTGAPATRMRSQDGLRPNSRSMALRRVHAAA